MDTNFPLNPAHNYHNNGVPEHISKFALLVCAKSAYNCMYDYSYSFGDNRSVIFEVNAGNGNVVRHRADFRSIKYYCNLDHLACRSARDIDNHVRYCH